MAAFVPMVLNAPVAKDSREIKKKYSHVQVLRLIHEFFNREVLNHAMSPMTIVSIHRLFIKNVDVYG